MLKLLKLAKLLDLLHLLEVLELQVSGKAHGARNGKSGLDLGQTGLKGGHRELGALNPVEEALLLGGEEGVSHLVCRRGGPFRFLWLLGLLQELSRLLEEQSLAEHGGRVTLVVSRRLGRNTLLRLQNLSREGG